VEEVNYRYDVQLMAKIAHLYYIDRLKQEEIAQQLKISRSMVSMVLSEALEKGIVEIKIRNPLLSEISLEAKFESLFPVKKCHIISTSLKEADTVRGIVAERAIKVFNEIVKDYDIAGLAWGRTCHEFVTLYESSKQLNGVSIVPLIGGSNQIASYFQINEMVRVLAEKMGGTPYFIHAPSVTPSLEDRDLFIKSSFMQLILAKWKSLDVVLTGIGAPPHVDDQKRERYIGEEAIVDKQKTLKPIGDICTRYFDINGQFIKNSDSENIIGVSEEELLSAKTVICFAGGAEKALSIIGALRTKVIDIFVCDEQTANEVIKIMSSTKE
jgi:DNA-binding transcriptional regulator LsrR (DeoR family)